MITLPADRLRQGPDAGRCALTPRSVRLSAHSAGSLCGFVAVTETRSGVDASEVLTSQRRRG